jgi:hypothetical protein
MELISVISFLRCQYERQVLVRTHLLTSFVTIRAKG